MLVSEIMKPIEKIITNDKTSTTYAENDIISNDLEKENGAAEFIQIKDESFINQEVDKKRQISKFSHLLDPVIFKYLVIASLLW